MGVNTQKLIITMLFISLLTAFVGRIDSDPTEFDSTLINTRTEQAEDFADDMEDDVGSTNPIEKVTNFVDQTAGNTIRMGLFLLRVFADAMNPFSVLPGSYDTEFENMVAYGLMFLKSIMVTLMGIEIYMVYKNRKQS